MKLDPAVYFPGLAMLTSRVGTDDFYSQLPELVGRPLRSERWLVVRYPRYAKPEFILNRAMDHSAVDLYQRGLYRLDPLLRLARTGTRSGVYSLQTLRHQDPNNSYFDEIFRSALIFDELSLFFGMPAHECLVICIDRDSHSFTDQEIEAVNTIYPLLRSLHKLHVERIFSHISHLEQALTLYPDRTTLILDGNLNVALTNKPSDPLISAIYSPLKQRLKGGQPEGEMAIDERLILHWEPLSPHFTAVPHGTLCVIEPASPSYTNWTFEGAMQAFASTHKLTPREQAVANLTLRGYPNALIASKLCIAPGTVRNHKYKLYYKLDITTERELFQLFIRLITADHPVGEIAKDRFA